MKWYKVYKTFRGGQSKLDYISVPDDCDEEGVREEAEYWADSSAGGSNYGWTVYWTKIDKPPIDWIQKQIYNILYNIEHYKNKLKEYENML